MKNTFEKGTYKKTVTYFEVKGYFNNNRFTPFRESTININIDPSTFSKYSISNLIENTLNGAVDPIFIIDYLRNDFNPIIIVKLRELFKLDCYNKILMEIVKEKGSLSVGERIAVESLSKQSGFLGLSKYNGEIEK